MLSSHDPPITLAKIDLSDKVNSEIATKFKIQGYPTIKILRSGGNAIQEYKGPREADGLVAYLKKQAVVPRQLKSSQGKILQTL